MTLMRSTAPQQRRERKASLQATIAKAGRSIRADDTNGNSTKHKRKMKNEGARESREDRDGGKDKCEMSLTMDGAGPQHRNQVACGQRRGNTQVVHNPYLKNKGEMPSSCHGQQCIRS